MFHILAFGEIACCVHKGLYTYVFITHISCIVKDFYDVIVAKEVLMLGVVKVLAKSGDEFVAFVICSFIHNAVRLYFVGVGVWLIL